MIVIHSWRISGRISIVVIVLLVAEFNLEIFVRVFADNILPCLGWLMMFTLLLIG